MTQVMVTTKHKIHLIVIFTNASYFPVDTQCLEPSGRNDGGNQKKTNKKPQLPAIPLPQDGTIGQLEEMKINIYKSECNC